MLHTSHRMCVLTEQLCSWTNASRKISLFTRLQYKQRDYPRCNRLPGIQLPRHQEVKKLTQFDIRNSVTGVDQRVSLKLGGNFHLRKYVIPVTFHHLCFPLKPGKINKPLVFILLVVVLMSESQTNARSNLRDLV